MLLRKGVKNANLIALRDPQFCHFKVAPLRRTWVAPLGRSSTRAGVYDKFVQKRITALADIRNNADHGHFNKYKLEDVEDMIKWVRRFSADYLH